ncbi:hypothetical protein Tco_0158246, partial [Tanacetum coccineum]
SKNISKTKNNKISQSLSSNKTNKVEDQSRSVKSRKNKKNHVAKTKCNAYVMQSMLNANSKFVCAICNECLFDANHDKCILDYVYDVNVLSKSKPAKRKNKKQIWKSTGSLSLKQCPLRKQQPNQLLHQLKGIMVYSRRRKEPKYVGLSSKSKIIEPRISNLSEPTQTGESTISNVPSYSLIDYRCGQCECQETTWLWSLGRDCIQHKLFQLNGSAIVDLIVAFRMFIRSLIINLRVEDLYLGVESYQKKLNITTPYKNFPGIEFKELYTPSYKPPGTIRDELYNKKLNFHLGYNKEISRRKWTTIDKRISKLMVERYNKEMSRRKWTTIDKRRLKLMVERIDKQMRERQIIRNLERLVGAQELEMDYRLMTRTK